MDCNESTYDVAVVGAGISGLYAANKLRQEHVNFVVLEGRDRVSGRQWTLRDDSCGYADMGAAYVGKQQTKIVQVLKDLELETYSKVSHLDSLLSLEGRAMRYRPPIPSFRNPLVLLDLNNILRLIDKLSLQLSIEEPWKHSKASEWDKMTVQQFLNEHVWTREVMALAKLCVSIPFVMEASKMSFLYFLHEVRLCGGIVAITSAKGGLQEMKIRGGANQMSMRLYENIKENVIFEELVKSVTQLPDHVQLRTDKGNIYHAKRVLLCIPLPALHSVQFDPCLPRHMEDYIKADQLGHTMKSFTFYKERFWEDAGLSGEMVFEGGPWAFDDTKPDGSFPAIMAFTSGEKGKNFATLSQEDRKKKLITSFAEVSGLEEFMHPVHYVDKYWQDEESTRFSRNCCVWGLPPGVITKHNRLPDQRCGNIYFASTEFALTFRSYMDGALRSSEKAVSVVLASLGIEPSYYDPAEFCEEIPYCKQSFIEDWLPDVPTFIGLSIALFIAIIGTLLL